MTMRSAVRWISLLALVALAACGGKQEPATPAPAPATPAAASSEPPPAELKITDMNTGAGPAIGEGSIAVVHYTGWLYDGAATDHKGAKFDSSRDRNEAFRFKIDGGEVIKGWDQGVKGMQAGGQRRLVIPPALGYGDKGTGGVIPPGATLVFDVELLAIESPTQQ